MIEKGRGSRGCLGGGGVGEGVWWWWRIRADPNSVEVEEGGHMLRRIR